MTDYRSHLKHSTGVSRGFKRGIERRLCGWLNDRYGCKVDADNRKTLVDELSDGVILCKLIRDLSGNRRVKFKAKRPNIFQKNENIRTFSQQCKKMGISDVATLAPSDLRDGSTKKVMACLMHLYRKSKDWTAKNGTKANPGVVKMVLVKPKRAKVEIVTDYLSQLKTLRRSRMVGSVVSVFLPKKETNKPPEKSQGSIAVKESLTVNGDPGQGSNVPTPATQISSAPSTQVKSEPDQDIPCDEGADASATQTSDAEPDRKPAVHDGRGEVSSGDTPTEDGEGDKEETEQRKIDSGPGPIPQPLDADELLVRVQELKLECDRLQRLGVRSAGQIADLEAQNQQLASETARERQQRLDLQYQLEQVSADTATVVDQPVESKLDTTVTEEQSLTASENSPAVVEQPSTKTETIQVPKEMEDNDEDDEESVDLGLDDGEDEFEDEDEEEIDEIEINEAADKQLSAVMAKAREEVELLQAECSTLRAKFEQAQKEAKVKGDIKSAQESKKQMEKYMTLLAQLQTREAEFDELQLDREELRRMRREAEARLASTTEKFEETKTKLQKVVHSEQALHDRCHAAEENARTLATKVEELQQQLKKVSSENASMKKQQKLQKKEIQQAAATAANDEIQAQTAKFEAKLRAKEAKVKDARKKARQALRDSAESKKQYEAQIESLSLQLEQSRQPALPGGQTEPPPAASQPRTPLQSHFDTELADAREAAVLAKAELENATLEIARLKNDFLESSNAVAAVTRRQQKQLRLELQDTKSRLSIVQAELELKNTQLLETRGAIGAPADEEQGGGAPNYKQQIMQLQDEIIQLKKSAGESQHSFLESVLSGDDTTAELQQKLSVLNERHLLSTATAARKETVLHASINTLTRRNLAFEKQLQQEKQVHQDQIASLKSRARTELADIASERTAAKEEVDSLKSDLAILLDKPVDGPAETAQELINARRVIKKAKTELEVARSKSLQLGNEVHKLREQLETANRKAIQACDNLAAEIQSHQQHTVHITAQSASAAARVEELQFELKAAGERFRSMKKSYDVQAQKKAVTETFATPPKDHTAIAGEVVPEASVTVDTTLALESGTRNSADPTVELEKLRLQVIALKRQEVDAALNRSELQELVEANATKEELLAKLREDVANLREDRDAALDEMSASKVASEKEVGAVGQKALKSATAARKKLSTAQAKLAQVEERLAASQTENNLLNKRLQVLHQCSQPSAEADSNIEEGATGKVHLQRLTQQNRGLLAEVSLLSDEVSKLRAQSVQTQSRSAQVAADASRSDQKAEAALELLQQARKVADKEKAAAAVREAQLRNELLEAHESMSRVHSRFETTSLDLELKIGAAEAESSAAKQHVEELENRVHQLLAVAEEASDPELESGESNDELRKAVRLLKTDNALLEESSSKLRRDFSEQNIASLDSIKSRFSAWSDRERALKAQVDKHKEKLQNLAQDLREAESAESTANLEIQALIQRLTAAENSARSATSQVSVVEETMAAQATAARQDAELLQTRVDSAQQRLDAVSSVVEVSSSGVVPDVSEFVQAAKDAASVHEQELEDLASQVRSERAEKLQAVKDLIEANAALKLRADAAKMDEDRLKNVQKQYAALKQQVTLLTANKNAEETASKPSNYNLQIDHSHREKQSTSEHTIAADDPFSAEPGVEFAEFDSTGDAEDDVTSQNDLSAAIVDEGQDDADFWGSVDEPVTVAALQQHLDEALRRVEHFEMLANDAQRSAMQNFVKQQENDTKHLEEVATLRAANSAVAAKLGSQLAAAQVDLAKLRATVTVSEPSQQRASTGDEELAANERDTTADLADQSLLATLHTTSLTVAKQAADIASLLATESALRKRINVLEAVANVDEDAQSRSEEPPVRGDVGVEERVIGTDKYNSLISRAESAERRVESLRTEVESLSSALEVSCREDAESTQSEGDSASRVGAATAAKAVAALQVAKHARTQLNDVVAEHKFMQQKFEDEAAEQQARVDSSATQLQMALHEVAVLKLKLVEEQQQHAVAAADAVARLKKSENVSKLLQEQARPGRVNANEVQQIEMPPPPLDLPFDLVLPGVVDGGNQSEAAPPVISTVPANTRDDHRLALENKIVELERDNEKLRASEQAAQAKLQIALSHAGLPSSPAKPQVASRSDPQPTVAVTPRTWLEPPQEASVDFVAGLKKQLGKKHFSMFKKASGAFRKNSPKMTASMYAQLFVELCAENHADPTPLIPGLLFMIEDEVQRHNVRSAFLDLMQQGGDSAEESVTNTPNESPQPPKSQVHTTTSVHVDSGSDRTEPNANALSNANTHEPSSDAAANEDLLQKVADLEQENRLLRQQLKDIDQGDAEAAPHTADSQSDVTDADSNRQRLQQLETELEQQREQLDSANALHAEATANLQDDVHQARESAQSLQSALHELSKQAESASSAQRLEAQREMDRMQQALQAQLESEQKLSQQLAERAMAHSKLQLLNVEREKQFKTEAAAIRETLEQQLAHAAQTTEETAIKLASEQINNLRAQSKKQDAINFEVQRQLNEKLALLSGTEEEKARRLQQFARTCEELRNSEVELRKLLEEERSRNEKLLEALQDQNLKDSLKAAEVPEAKPLTEEEKAAAAEAERIRPLSVNVRHFLEAVAGPSFDAETFQRLPPWEGFVVETGEGGEGDAPSVMAIRSISLSGMRLRGRLPDCVVEPSENGDADEMDIETSQQLLKLTTFALGNNRIEGRLPRTLLLRFNPTELRFLELNDNSFNGKIPTEIGNFSNLLELKLQYNKFTGIVPSEFGQLSQLQRLHLGRNALSGPLPSELGNLSQLRIAEFHNNRLTGVPAEHWGGLKRLTELKLQGNSIRSTNDVRAALKAALGVMCYVVL